MRNVTTYESDGFYCVSYMREPSYDGDLGRGGETIMTRFRSEEARAMFISYTRQIEQLGRKNHQLDQRLHYLSTVKGANENLRAVRSRRKAER